MVRAAVVGTGFIGPVHVEGIRRAGIEVIGISGSSPARAEEAAKKLGIPRAYATFDDLLADRDVEAVHITSPNRFHFDQASKALQAGKHVMCEKPLAMHARESAELVRIAAASGKAAGVNYNVRYYPLCLEARERIKAGMLGDVFHVAGGYVQDWLLYDTDFNWRVLAEDGGALRAVSDIGTHWLDLVQNITGLEVTAVCADLKTVYPIRKRPKGGVETFSGKTRTITETEDVAITTDDYGGMLLRFNNGTKGICWVSQVTAGRKNCLRFEIAGAKQSLAWNSESPNDLWIGRRETANELLIRDPALLSGAAKLHADYPGGHNEGFPDSFKQCFRAFYNSIADGSFRDEPYFPTFADGHREIVLCDAVVESAREEKWVEVKA